MLQYDTSAFHFFLLSLLSFYLIPCTFPGRLYSANIIYIYIWWRTLIFVTSIILVIISQYIQKSVEPYVFLQRNEMIGTQSTIGFGLVFWGCKRDMIHPCHTILLTDEISSQIMKLYIFF